MTSAGYVRGLVTIHTTSDASSPKIDYDDVKNLKIHEVENYGSTGTVQLVNNYPDQTKNLLSNYCTLWSDGTARKLDRAMFLRIYHDSRTTDNAIGVYLITQINASDGLITLTFCDSVQYLRSIGSDYVRNHTHPNAVSPHPLDVFWESNEARIHHESGAVLYGGEHKDIKMDKPIRVKYDENNDAKIAITIPNRSHVGMRMNLGRTATHVHKIIINNIHVIRVPIKPLTGIMQFLTTDNSWITNSFRIETIGVHTLTFDFSSNPIAMNRDKLWLFLEFDEALPPIMLSIGMQKDVSGSSTEIGKNGGNIDVYENHAMTVDVILSYNTDNVVGTNSDTYFTVSSLDGETPTQEMIELIGNYPGRTIGLYVDPHSRINANEVFQRIVKAVGFTADQMQGMRDVHVFRCNGDYIHNYLLALADMPQGDRQFAFRSSPTVWNHLNAGYRFKKTDQTFVYFYYAYFGAIEGGKAMMSFNPSISMKNHPRLSTVKGATEEKKPIMVTLLDPNVPIGASVPNVNGSATNVVEGALAAYSDIITNRSNDWQGEIKASGIHLEYFGRGSAVGGIPISITDHRYGFADYKGKVKEITWDFAGQTTEITVNNYSEIYSNAVLDTSKMAYSAGDMSAEGTNIDMFCRQYVNIDATDMTSDGTVANMTFNVSAGTAGSITDATMIDLPELNIRVVNGYFPVGTGESTSQYGVISVTVGNRTHEIPEARRPDKYSNQSLIVNVIYRLS